ncbi:hypothetical protein [Bdellovibrio sp. HCB337]|uniref:hypothetical protein n=1 Tax=Bdellovibrio sp. HCB337 TaxID=3394358 RepID=UPI0039A5DF86
MSNIDKDIVKDFIGESKVLIQDLIELLENIEGDFSQVSQLEEYGQKVDRVMGGAKSLALLVPPEHALHVVADYAALCKAVGYKASQIQGNPQFYDVCVALLLDATETLSEWIDSLEDGDSGDALKKSFSTTFLERLRWVSNQFGADVRASVDAQKKKMDQNEIDELLRKLGVG